MLVISRQINEEIYVIPRKDPNYLKNTIKIKINSVGVEKVKLGLDYNIATYVSNHEESKELKLKKGEQIVITPKNTIAEGDPVTITIIDFHVNKLRIGIHYKQRNRGDRGDSHVFSPNYVTHRKEIFEAIERQGGLEKELGLGE